MNPAPIVSARMIRLFNSKESLAYRMLMIADQFGLKITEHDIKEIIASIDTSKVPDHTQDTPSDTEFVSILVFIFVQSYITFPVCAERYLDYLDMIFKRKCGADELRMADILFYAIFTDRMTKPR